MNSSRGRSIRTEELGGPDEEEAEFMDDSDDMHEAPSTSPSRAGGAEMPDRLDEENFACNDYRNGVVARFIAERSKYSRPADLEFKVSTSGDLWVKWWRDWKLLTWKSDPKKKSEQFFNREIWVSLGPSLGSDARGAIDIYSQ